MAQSPKRWTYIDEVERSLLALDDSDTCFYYLVRTSEGYDSSEANSRIANFKKNPELYRGKPDIWRYKEAEIARFARDICGFINNTSVQRMLNNHPRALLTPIPTSKPKAHQFYDSRLEDLCRTVESSTQGILFDSLFDVSEEIQPAHQGGPRDIDYLKSKMVFEMPPAPGPDLVFLVDDVLTKGNHYVACRDALRNHYPNITIIGLFLSIHRSMWVDYAIVNIDPQSE